MITWYIIIAAILCIASLIVAISLVGEALDDFSSPRGPDTETWTTLAVALGLPILSWLWPLVLGIIALVVAMVLVAIPLALPYVLYRLYRSWKTEG